MKNFSKNRPIFKYYGGKWQLAKWIISYFPPHRIYVEPFGGSGSLLMQKQRSKYEIYNDLDGNIVNVFRVLQDRTKAQELKRLINLTPYSRKEFELAYEYTDDPVEAARRTLIKGYLGFGSAGSVNKSKTGFRTKPKSENSIWANYSDFIEVFTDRLRGVIIECGSAIKVIKQQDSKETLFYVDPPYVKSTRGSSGVYRCEMTDQDHKKLAEILNEIQGMAVLSGYDCSLYQSLYSSWTRKSKSTQAIIGPKGCELREDSLWLSPNTTKALSSTSGFRL